MKLLLPDPIWTPALVPGAAYLWLLEDGMGMTAVPSMIVYPTGVKPSTYLSYLHERNPAWRSQFLRLWNAWREQSLHVSDTSKILEPLVNKAFRPTVMVYERGSSAWIESGELLAAASMTANHIIPLIDTYHAADELLSHIFIEKVYEFQNQSGVRPNPSPGGITQITIRHTSDATTFVAGDAISDYDWAPIHEYCDSLFHQHSVEELLSRAYMFRLLPRTIKWDEFLWTNPMLGGFIRTLPAQYARIKALGAVQSEFDPVAYEMFRQLLEHYLDPVDSTKVCLIEKMVNDRRDEIARLKNKCLALARDMGGDDRNSSTLRTQKVREFIKAKVTNDLYELLQTPRREFRELLSAIFADEKAWMGFAAFAFSCLCGNPELAAGSAMVTAARVGAKGVKHLADRQKQLDQSPYALIHRLRRHVPAEQRRSI